MIPIFYTNFFKISFATEDLVLPETLTREVLLSLLHKVCCETLRLIADVVPVGWHDYNCAGMVPFPGEMAYLCALSGKEFECLKMNDDESNSDDEEGSENDSDDDYQSEDGSNDSVTSQAKNVLLYYTALDPILQPHEIFLCGCLKVERVENEFQR